MAGRHLVGAAAGLVLLLASAVYITALSVPKMASRDPARATTGDGDGKVDGNVILAFAIAGAVVDVVSAVVLVRWARPQDVFAEAGGGSAAAGSFAAGSLSLMSVGLHLGADMLRLVALFFAGVLAINNEADSEAIDATAALVVSIFMYVGGIYFLVVIVRACRGGGKGRSADGTDGGRYTEGDDGDGI